MKFKILFPVRYQVKDHLNDNMDIHIVLQDNRVFVSSLFTLDNIVYLMTKDKRSYCWSSDMLIVKDLRKETIQLAVQEMLTDGFLESACAYIGNIQSQVDSDCYPQYQSFEDLPEMTHLY